MPTRFVSIGVPFSVLLDLPVVALGTSWTVDDGSFSCGGGDGRISRSGVLVDLPVVAIEGTGQVMISWLCSDGGDDEVASFIGPVHSAILRDRGVLDTIQNCMSAPSSNGGLL